MELNPHYLKIWKTVQAIPEGKVSSYGQIADLAGLPGRSRLVGKCLGYIPENGVDGFPVPWYRVIRSSGEIAFESGSEKYQEQRSCLLQEGVTVKGRRVSMKEFQWQPDLSELLFKLVN
ncbi:MGMT family protein [Psychrosphaera ytuae]|uniref:MGMT family protein n=1 Tax=Psychrosphaera ytuae TaxID=2820710 RepID=A0A975D9G0_9GAMM|nr:MGMT family protein [Psychrosphaera ytuae]QTH62987.1 MGMT family protein [Psychrosphaera ytuae]